MHSKDVRHTITVNEMSFRELRSAGRFGESYSQLILRILNELRQAKGESE